MTGPTRRQFLVGVLAALELDQIERHLSDALPAA